MAGIAACWTLLLIAWRQAVQALGHAERQLMLDRSVDGDLGGSLQVGCLLPEEIHEPADGDVGFGSDGDDSEQRAG